MNSIVIPKNRKQLSQALGQEGHLLYASSQREIEVEYSKNEWRTVLTPFFVRLLRLNDSLLYGFLDTMVCCTIYGLFMARWWHPGDDFSLQKIHWPRFPDPIVAWGFQLLTKRKIPETVKTRVDACVDLLARTDVRAIFAKSTRTEDPTYWFYSEFLKAYNSPNRARFLVSSISEPIADMMVYAAIPVFSKKFGSRERLADGIKKTYSQPSETA